MIASFIITFRETLEAALIIGIILSYLIKTKREKFNNVVYIGIAAALVASVIGAILFNKFAGGFTGRAEEIFEGIAMLIASILITYMILWMLKQKHIVVDLQKHIDTQIIEKHKAGLFFLVFISVFREGIETVIFLGAASFVSTENNLIGAFLGVVCAIVIGYLIYIMGKKINLKTFFNVTSVLLILFAAGLLAHGVHEFQEAKLLPIYAEHIWDINPEVNLDGSFPLLHEKGTIGSIAKGLFGYNGNPNLLEVIVYVAYLLVALILWRNINYVHKVI